MRKHTEMCKLLLEGDSYFNGKDLDTNEIIKKTSIKGYCRNDRCKKNEARINALTLYIHMEFKNLIKKKSEYSNYDEWLLMWISDKLFKIHKEAKNIGEGRMDGTTLNQAYDTYLKDHKVGLDYWVLLDMIKGLKEANLKYMSEFYKLLNIICKTIVDYKDNGTESKKLSKNSISCRRQYRTLYNNIFECKSYLDLLNKLKGLYDDFRSSAIKKNGSKNNLETILQKLTLGNGTEMKAVRGFKTYDFSGSECKFPKKKKKPEKSSLQPSNQLKDSKRETPPTQKPEIKEPKQQLAPQLSQAPASNIQKDSPGSQGISGGTSDQLSKHGAISQNSDDGQNNPASNSGTPKNQADIPSVQDKAQETNPTTSENTGKERIQRSDIPDTGNKGDKLKVSDPISQDKQDHQPSEDKNPPIKSGSELKDDVKDIDKPPIDTDTQDGSSNGSETKQDKIDTSKGTDTGTGNPGSVSGGGQDGRIGDSGSGGGGAGLGTGGEPASIQNDKGSSGGGTRGTINVPDGQIPNGTQGGADTSQQGTNDQGTTSHQGGDTSGGANGDQEKSPGAPGITVNLQGSSNDGTEDSGSGTGSGAEGTGGITGNGKVGSNGGMGDQENTGSQVGGGGEPGETRDLQVNHGSQEGSNGDKGSQDGSGDADKGPSNTGSGQNDKEGSGGGPGSGSGSEPGSEQGSQGGSGGSDNGQGVKDSEGGGTGGGGGDTDSKGGGPSSDQGGNPGSDDQGNNSDGSSDLWQPLFKFVFNGMDKFNKASKFVNEHQQKFKDAKDKINNAFNEVKDNFKIFYDQSINHFSEFINNITDEFKQANTPKSGNLDNKPPQNSDNSQKSGDPSQPPPQDPSSPPDSPKGPSANTKSTTPIDPTSQNQPPSQSQPTTQQNPQDGTSDQKKIDKTNLQLVKSSSPDPNLKKTWSIIPTTWNGSEDCKPEITFMNTTLACCTSKQCSITGIPIILVLIPIILLIVCKYLSSEWRKEMTRKKNMTKVINVVGVNKTTKMVINSSDGKKQIQIIIKSSSQKKQTKKSINSVNRKKSPSLNMYQLMQADPVPFINLIFLLIFFVYKRKRDFIE
ncbi:CIR protein [Plasmodium chabaudi chabaudi]|uniref:CIR protein n=1 Tax=Plasmodium chabaudi chabaudi TaxID=31271 RepID=A0A4V6M8P7_PLACU|nr:CIR protein [Plasmodium chabaudi chabaudi]VTZ66329.1 CIR protein [Plasmodium chabaudi chabaudi]|eukprot:XP_016653044.1 CIR protein [Plasmodium chabaudi chabaudi]